MAGALDRDPRKPVELLVPTANLAGFVRSRIGPLRIVFEKLKIVLITQLNKERGIKKVF